MPTQDSYQGYHKEYPNEKGLTFLATSKMQEDIFFAHWRVKIEKADQTKHSKNIKQLKLSHIAGEGWSGIHLWTLFGMPTKENTLLLLHPMPRHLQPEEMEA